MGLRKENAQQQRGLLVPSYRDLASALVSLVRPSKRHRNQTSACPNRMMGEESEESWLRNLYCENCGRAEYAESSGDGQVTCFRCGEVDEER